MATQEKTWNVANRMHSQKDSDNPEVNHIITGADEIYDDDKGAKQSDINAQTDAALADRYTKAETYSKEQLDSLITTPDANYVTVATFADLPQTGEGNTVYRVSSYDGTQMDASKYALYAWNGTVYQLLAVRSAVGEVFDVSEYNSHATYETLAVALAAVPTSVQRGGMSIKFILRTNTGTEEEPVYHDEYVQYRLMNTDWSTVITDWQGVDKVPTPGSHNFVESGGVQNELALGAIYDVSAKNPTAGPNNDGKFESLSALLSDANLNTLIPTAYRKGGMSIKFVQSSDNKYVQYRLMADDWSVNIADWSICSDTILIKNPEFIKVYTDKNGKILWGIKTNGSIYYGVGIPAQIVTYIQEKIAEFSLEETVAFLDGIETGGNTLQGLLDEKVDKENGKSLIDAKFASLHSVIDNKEFYQLTLDSNGRIIEAIKADGTKLLTVPFKFQGCKNYSVNNPEWIKVITDKEGKVLWGIKANGTIYPLNEKANKDDVPTKEALNKVADDLDIYAATPIQIIESCAASVGSSGQAVRHKKLVVAHITDTHNDIDRMARFAEFCGYDIIDFAIHTGDIAAVSAWNSLVSEIDKDIYLTLGNHDTTSHGPNLNSYLLQNYITPMATKDGISLSDNYYYIDNSDYGNTIRFIFMNEYDYPDSVTDSQIDDGFYNSIYSQAQIDWLIDTLQDCIDNNYYAVICSHQRPAKTVRNNKPFFQEHEFWNPAKNYTGDILGDIVNIYKHGGSLTKNYPPTQHTDLLPTITINHQFTGTGKFIAFINGHSHGDYIGYSENYSDQLMLNGNIGKGSRYISPSTQQENVYSDLPRSTDDETQDCYNVYVFDIDNSCVHVVRVGSNLTYYMKLRKYSKFNF